MVNHFEKGAGSRTGRDRKESLSSGLQFRLPLHIHSFLLLHENWDKSLEFLTCKIEAVHEDACDMHDLYTQTNTSTHIPSERWCSPLKALRCAVLSSYHGYCTFCNHAGFKVLTPANFHTSKWSVALPFKHPFYMMNVLEQHSMHSYS